MLVQWRRDAVVLGAVVVAALGLGVAKFTLVPETVRDSAFVFGEESVALHLTDALRKGGVLYETVHSQYGPLSAYLHLGWARAFGNTVTAYLSYHLFLSVLHITLVYVLFRRYAGLVPSMVVTVLGLIPLTLTPVCLFGGYMTNAHQQVERCLFAASLLAWSPPQHRAGGRNLIFGLLLGLWQLDKFGGALFFFAAVLLLDVVMMAAERLLEVRAWLLNRLAAALGFLMVEGTWAAWCGATLPRHLAVDVLLPLHMTSNYSAISHTALDFWHGWRTFVGMQMVVFTGALLGLVGAAVWLARTSRTAPGEAERDALRDQARVFLPYFFLAVGLLGYIYIDHHLIHWWWALLVPATYLLGQLPVKVLFVIAVLWLPSFLNSVKVCFPLRDPGPRVRLELPTGEVLHLEPSAAEDLSAILQAAGQGQGRAEGKFLFVPMSGGLQMHFGFPQVTRVHCFFPAFFRPYDEQALLEHLPEIQGIFVRVDHHLELPPLEVLTAMTSRELLTSLPSFRKEFAERLATEFASRRRVSERVFFLSRPAAAIP